MTTGPIPVVARGPVSCGSVLWSVGGALRATVVVKATFQLTPGGSARLVAPVDVADGAPYLPSAGVVLVGAAHAPFGMPTPAMAVRLSVHAGRPLFAKMLHVYGERSMAAPTPRAFTTMPIVYERAFGGPQVEDNPLGQGSGVSGPLPNVVDPADPRRPAGFGPIAAAWGARRRLLGGRAEPTPDRFGVLDVPRDLDWRWFHVAPGDQQTPFLAGDEVVVLEGLHPEHGRVSTRLPGARASAWIGARRIELVADTLLIGAHALAASIVWRGNFAVESLEAASRLRVEADVMVPGQREPREVSDVSSVGDIRGLEEQTHAGEGPVVGYTLPFAPSQQPLGPHVALPAPRPPASPARHPSAPPGLPVIGPDADDDSENEKTRAVSVTALAARAVAPFAIAAPGAARSHPVLPGAPWSPVPAARLPDIVDEMTIGAMLEPPALLTSAPASALPGLGIAPPARDAMPGAASPPALLTAIEPPPLVAGPAPPRQPEASPRDPAVVDRAAPARTSASAKTSAPVKAGDDDAAMQRAAAGRAAVIARLAAGKSLEGVDAEHADLTSLDLRGSSLARAKLRGARLEHARLDDVDLRGADLSEATFANAQLPRAKIDEAKFTSAKGPGANLDGAVGKRADFSGANLDGATFRACDLPAVNLRGASIARARFDGAQLGEAILSSAAGADAVFDGAAMKRAQLKGATMKGASFRQATLDLSAWDRADVTDARFEHADLRGASMPRATANDAHFVGADLGDATLERLEAERADFAEANLGGANLRKAKLQGASFAGATLNEASGERADCAGANFTGADLRDSMFKGAILSGANASLARFERADLRDADLRNTLLRGANRAGAKTTGADFTGALEVPLDSDSSSSKG